MKLLIDVDEKLVCEGFERPFTEEEKSILIRAIGNGKSYNPTGDLISREVLKEVISKVVAEERKEDEKWAAGLRYALKLIDNAPAVEPCYQTTSCLDCINYDKENYNCPRFCEVIKEAIKSRPQGEWYYGEDECGQDGWFCSECNFFVPWYYQYYEKDINFIRDYKACPHCLAEMITYTGKDRDTKGDVE